jgi:hypothetical protein
MQEDIDTYDIGPKWSSIVEHYWWKRFVANKESPTQRYRKAVINDIKFSMSCKECGKLYSQDAVDVCWTCSKYTCTSCAEIIIRPEYPNMDTPPSCTKCVTKCHKCEKPFIQVYKEKHCFECQYNTKMFTVTWNTRSKTYGLPYGTSTLKKLYKTYLNSLNRSDHVYGNIIVGEAVAIGNNSIAVGYAANSHNFDYRPVAAHTNTPADDVIIGGDLVVTGDITTNNVNNNNAPPRPKKPTKNGHMNPEQRRQQYLKYQADLKKWKEENGD